MKFETSRQIFEKYSKYIKLYENPSSGNRVVPRGRTNAQSNKHGQANSRFSQFRERERA